MNQMLASDDRNPEFVNPKNPDAALEVLFYKRRLPDNFKSEKEGKAIFYEQDWVRIMIPGRHIDMPFVRMASRFHYGELLAAGVRILEYNRTMMHQKNAVIDGLFSTVGSINFDTRSLRGNAEDSLAIYDRDFAARLEATFTADETYCREVTYQSWKRRGVEQRLAELVSVFFKPLY